jgi:hypothetical protein
MHGAISIPEGDLLGLCAAKNYVAEEKRIAREAGVYSGFDS